MEWGAFASSARSHGFRHLIDCEAAEKAGLHESDGCLERGLYVRARLPDPYTENGVPVILAADEVIAHIGDGIHDWGTRPMIDRLEAMGICPMGLLASPGLTGVVEAYDLVALEGLSEQFGLMPSAGGLSEQAHGLIESFSVIRAARNLVQERRMKEIQAKG